MHVGFMYWPSDVTVAAPDVARALEARGFSSLWVSEHSHIPVSRETPWPVNPDAELPMAYLRMHDPFIALAGAAMVTERLVLGTGICLLAQRDPINTAKQLASLDHLAGGRLVFGIGYGWNIEELRHHGIDPAQRKQIMREHVGAMRRLWVDEVASYDGQFVHLAPSWQWPKPVRHGGPPVMLGAPTWAFREIAAWADGWVGVHHDQTLAHEIPLLRRRIEEAGRDATSVAIHVLHSYPTIESLEAYQEADVDEVILFPFPWEHPDIDTTDGLLRHLDELAVLVERFSEVRGQPVTGT